MRILLVEDDHKIAHNIKKGLELEAFAVDLAFDGITGYDLAASEDYQLIILDLMIPRLDGLAFTRQLRAASIHTPIIILTAKSQLEDKITGLNAGADDYLTKPFAFEELLARIRALTRRPTQTLSTKLKYDDLTLNTITFEVKRSASLINLSQKEYAILEYLLRHPNQILSKDQIIGHIWDYDSDVLPNTVEVYIGYLRAKIDRPFPNKPPLLHTLRGFGYKIGESK